jgi:hypothetical protein
MHAINNECEITKPDFGFVLAQFSCDGINRAFGFIDIDKRLDGAASQSLPACATPAGSAFSNTASIAITATK